MPTHIYDSSFLTRRAFNTAISNMFNSNTQNMNRTMYGSPTAFRSSAFLDIATLGNTKDYRKTEGGHFVDYKKFNISSSAKPNKQTTGWVNMIRPEVEGGKASCVDISINSDTNTTVVVGQYSGSSMIYTGNNSTISINAPKNTVATFLTHFEDNGKLKWVTKFTATKDGKASIIPSAVVTVGNVIYVTGTYTNEFAIYTGTYADPTNIATTIPAPLGNTAGFIAKFSTSGLLYWAKEITSDKNEYINVNSIAVDLSGVYITGDFSNNIIFTKDNKLSGSYNYNTFIAKYNKDGVIEWAKQFENIISGANFGKALVTSGDALYITGRYTNISAIDKGAPIGARDNTYIIKCQKDDGSLIWFNKISGATFNESSDISTDGEAIYVSGFYTNACRFESTTEKIIELLSDGTADGFVAKYNKTGTIEWVSKVNGSNNIYGKSVSATKDGVYVTGVYSGSVGIYESLASSNTIPRLMYTVKPTEKENDNIYIIKYSTHGKYEWHTIILGNGKNTGNRIRANNDSLYIVGDVTNTVDIYQTNNTEKAFTIDFANNMGIIIKYNKHGSLI